MTSPSPNLEELLARVEAATGPDRKLDEALAVWTYPELATYPRSNTGGWLHPQFGKIAPADGYTSSLDAALALVERVRPGWTLDCDATAPDCGIDWTLHAPKTVHGERDTFTGTHDRHALALIAALLKTFVGDQP